MKKHLTHKNSFFLFSKRFIFDNEVAPAPIDQGPEGMKGQEKQKEAAMVSEAASQSPSQIAAQAAGGMKATGAKYTQSTQILANLLPPTNSTSPTNTTDSD